MSKLDFDAFADSLGSLALMLDHELTDAKIEAYFKFFERQGYAYAAVLAAIDKAAETCKFFPKPAELVELITGGKGGGQDPTAAWQQLLRNLETIGAYNSAEFQDGAIAAAVTALGGWPELAQMDYKTMSTQRIQARFEALYSEAIRQKQHLTPGKVPGLFEIENAARGIEHDPAETRQALSLPQIMNQSRQPARPVLPAPVEYLPEDQTLQILGEVSADLTRISQRKAM